MQNLLQVPRSYFSSSTGCFYCLYQLFRHGLLLIFERFCIAINQLQTKSGLITILPEELISFKTNRLIGKPDYYMQDINVEK